MLKYNKKVLLILLVASFCLVGCVNKEEISIEKKETSEENDITESMEEIIEVVDEKSGDASKDTAVKSDNQELKEELGKDDVETQDQTEPAATQDKIEAVTVDLTGTNYNYFLSDFEPYYDLESEKTLWRLKPIFGFNVPEGYIESSYGSASLQDNPELCAYTSLKFYNPSDVGYIIVGISENNAYLEEFIVNDTYIEGFSINEVNVGMDYISMSLCSMEKIEKIETPYGTAQIIYQTLMANDEKMVNQEIILFNVNEFDVVVVYEYYNNDETPTSKFEGKLKKLLPEMLANK